MGKFDIGIHCGHFLSMKGGRAEPERGMFIGISGDKIAEVSPWSEAKKAESREFIDGSRFVALPGFVNAHAHLAMTLFRGLEDDVNFHTWLFERILPLEDKLVEPGFVRAGTELAMLESIRFGVTTFADMYFLPAVGAEVMDRAGVRGWVAQPWASGPLAEDKTVGSDKEALFRDLHAKYKNHPRIVPAIGPHAPYTCDDPVWRQVVALSYELHAPIHTHLAETAYEVEESKKRYGVSPTKRLHALGTLGPRTLCAHCVHMSDEDVALMRASGASMVHNPDSNLKLGSGLAPVVKYRASGIKVALGTDGSASNNDLSMFGPMDLATKVQKALASDNTAMTAGDALVMATYEGARALGLDSKIGSLEVGKEADVVLIDLDFAHLQPVYDVRSALVYAAQGLETDTVLCAGKVLMRGKEIRTVERDRVHREVGPLRDLVERTVRTF